MKVLYGVRLVYAIGPIYLPYAAGLCVVAYSSIYLSFEFSPLYDTTVRGAYDYTVSVVHRGHDDRTRVYSIAI